MNLTLSQCISDQLDILEKVGRAFLIGTFAKGKCSEHNVDILVIGGPDVSAQEARKLLLQEAEEFYNNTSLVLHVFVYGILVHNTVYPVFSAANNDVLVGLLTTGKPWHRYWHWFWMTCRSWEKRLWEKLSRRKKRTLVVNIHKELLQVQKMLKSYLKSVKT